MERVENQTQESLPYVLIVMEQEEIFKYSIMDSSICSKT
jgi:hypothetical protein